MGFWKQKGDGKHDQVIINGSGGNDSVRHIKSRDKTGGTKIVSQSFSSNNSKKEKGHTTVHGNNHVNKHGSHKR